MMSHKTLFIIVLLGISAILNMYLLFSPMQKSVNINNEENEQTEFGYLSPRASKTYHNDIFLNFTTLRKALREYIKASPIPIHLYFEYLPSGTTIGIGDQEEIPTASLVKIPTVMGIYKKLENKELTKDKLLTVTEKQLDSSFGDFWKKGAGATISVNDAIKKTIVDSDNTTHNLLYNLLTQQERKDIFGELDIVVKNENNIDTPSITAKSYSSILKSLYFSTFLQNESSNEILEVMTKTTDTSKLVAGIDPSIKVAHKIGVNEKNPEIPYSHDCGVVYVPKRPYIVCIMIQGNESDAQKNIQALSQLIYAFITQK